LKAGLDCNVDIKRTALKKTAWDSTLSVLGVLVYLCTR